MEHSEHFMAGTGEKVQYMVHNFNDNTIRFIQHYPGRPDSAVLRLAVKTVIDKCIILHSSFTAGKMKAYWKVNESYSENDYFQVTEVTDNLMETACEIAAKAVLPTDKTQLCCHLLTTLQECALVVCISHLCVDGSDGKYLLAKLAEAYRLILEKGNAEELEIKDGSRKAEQVYEQISKKDYMSLMHNPIPGIKSVFPYPTQEPGRACLVYEKITSQTLIAAKEKAAVLEATLNDVLLTACYYAYASLPGKRKEEAMSIMSMMDLRRHCKAGDSEGLCNITGSLPTTLPEGIGASFEETLKKIAAQTRMQKENPLAGMEGMPLLHGVVRTIPMGMLQLAAKHVYGSMAVGLTNLGVLKAEEFAFDNLQPDMAVFGGPLKKKPAMQVSAISLDGDESFVNGGCTLSVAGEMTKEDEMLILRMLEQIRSEIEKFAGGNDGE